MTDVLESSESLSSQFVKPEAKPCTRGNFVVIDRPVPCTLCSTNFKSRAEQLQHYHDPQHVERASKAVQKSSAAFFKPADELLVDDVAEEKKIYIEEGDALSQSGCALAFYCADCGVEFSGESAYSAHLKTKRHAISCGKVSPHHE